VESGLVRESVFRPAHARILEARFPWVELIEAATEPALAAALARLEDPDLRARLGAAGPASVAGHDSRAAAAAMAEVWAELGVQT